MECIEPGYEDEIADCLEQYPLDVVSDLVPDLEDLSFPDDSLVDSSAEDTSTPEDRDLPPALNELQATSSPEAAPKSAPGAFFEVPLDAIRVRVQAEPTLAEPTERVAPTPTPTPKPTSQPVSTSRRAPGVALRVLSQPNVLSYYPLEARRRGIEGRALVLLDVDTRGHVTRARILQSTGSPLLDRQAVRYTRAMRFHPGSGGQLRAPVHFSLR